MIKLNYDICILGAGPAGCAAAIAARRMGARVLLVERDGVPGGMATSGLLNVWCGDAYGSVFNHILERTTTQDERRRIYAPETLKLLLIDMLTDAGVELLLHSLVTGVDASEGRISAVHIHCKSGEILVNASAFIDCTGDGDVAAMAGVPFDMGRDDGLMQPMTLEFMLGGVDHFRAAFASASSPEMKAKMQEYLSDGRVSFPVGSIILIKGLDPNTVFVNMTNVIRVDSTNVFDLTRAELEARRQVPQIVQFLRENAVGYEDCFVLSTAAYAGSRESRRIRGQYTMTAADVQNGVHFEDWIVDGATYCFGVHNPEGFVGPVRGLPNGTGLRYTLPYRCFTPLGMKNLLMAGRCISGDHYAHSSYRVMPICFAMGEGVGTCAALAVRDGTDATCLSSEQLQEVQRLLVCGLY